MTTLSLLGGTWEYQFEDETTTTTFPTQVGTRMIKYISGGVITVNALYSAIADAADDFQAMGYKNPILPVTPNEYTLQNQAFISRKSTEFLKEGTISADWSLTTAPDALGNGVLRVPYTGGTNFVTGDIGRRITDGTDFGTLLDFEVEPDATLIAWIRPEDSTPTTGSVFDGTGSLTVVADGGTGASTSHTAVTVEGGVSTYTAIQAIGSVPTATDVYIIQNRIKLANADSSTGFQFWSTDSNVSLGIISVLIRTEIDGIAIADEDLEVFARKYGSLYDNFRLNVSAGGFSALPLASSADINNTTGYRTTGTLTGVSGTFNVGNGIYVGASWTAATARGVITETNTNTDLEYYLVGDLTDISSTTAITEYDFVTQADGDASATTGTVAVNLTGPTDTASGEGGNLTITIGTTTSDHDNSGNAEPYSVTIDAQSNIPIAKVYERIKYVTRRGSDNTFWDTISSSISGEQFRGIDSAIYYDGLVGSALVEGENLFNETQTQQTTRLMGYNSGATGENVSQAYITISDTQTSVVSVANNDIFGDNGSTDSVVVDTAGAGGSIVSHASVKSSPFGSFTGSQIFGAPGILYINEHADDTQAYILTDDLGTLRTPPNTVSYTVANTRSGDRILVARDTGTSGVINKDQFGGMTVTSASATSITVAGTIDAEVPTSGFIRIVENTLQEDHKYEYSSRTTGASGVFTLKAVTPGTATAGTSTTQLSDSGADFVTDGVTVGMLVQNTTSTETYEVVSVSDLNTLVIKQVFGTGGTFASTNTYTINETIHAYATTDDLYDLIIDAEENTGTDGSPGTILNTFVKTAGSFGTVVQVRQGKTILPFEQNQTQGQGNTTVTAVRTADTIAV